MPDNKNLDDLSINKINELFNSIIEGPDEWKISGTAIVQTAKGAEGGLGDGGRPTC